MTLTEEVTAINILNWESVLNERHDMFEFKVVARVDYMTGWCEEEITGYTMQPTLEAIIDELHRMTGCDKEWIWK